MPCGPFPAGFALVGGPARQDAPRAIDALKKLNVPYMVSLPLVFQTTEEWLSSELGLHPVQVALQVSTPKGISISAECSGPPIPHAGVKGALPCSLCCSHARVFALISHALPEEREFSGSAYY